MNWNPVNSNEILFKKFPNITGDITDYIKENYMNSVVVNDTNESEKNKYSKLVEFK